MILITALDDNNGMLFNKRRQSQDKELRQKMLHMSEGSRLWLSPYSAKQFEPDYAHRLSIADDPAASAGEGEYCFIEDTPFAPYEEKAEKIIVFRWNRVYPADRKFDISLTADGRRLVSSEDLPGNSHENITMEVYEK